MAHGRESARDDASESAPETSLYYSPLIRCQVNEQRISREARLKPVAHRGRACPQRKLPGGIREFPHWNALCTCLGLFCFAI